MMLLETNSILSIKGFGDNPSMIENKDFNKAFRRERKETESLGHLPAQPNWHGQRRQRNHDNRHPRYGSW